MPPFDASPSEAKVTGRSAVSSSPPPGSTQSATNRRRRRRLPADIRGSSPLMRRRPTSSSQTDATGVLRVSYCPIYPCSPSFPGRRRAPLAGEPIVPGREHGLVNGQVCSVQLGLLTWCLWPTSQRLWPGCRWCKNISM
jgi:hypothetical protein